MASTFLCPKGHASVDNDFCSECGAKIQGAPVAARTSSASGGAQTSNGRVCPDCGAPAPAGINFCEICGYNFVTRTSGGFPDAVVKPTPAVETPVTGPEAVPVSVVTPTPVTAPTSAPSPVAVSFQLVIAVDASLRDEGSPEAPADTVPVLFVIDKPVNLVGRKSEARAIYPEIALDADTAVSHRHGVISLAPDGSLVYRDLGSSNGTRLNGTDLQPLADTPLKIGDQLTLGHWTRITVEAKA